MDEEKVRIKLNIAGEQLVLTVPYSQQEAARQTETELNTVFSTWRGRFPGKSDRELLVMIAFRYAERYAALSREKEETEQELGELNTLFDNLIKKDSLPS